MINDHLKSFIERIERLEAEKKAIADDIREVYAEAKAVGFDAKAMRELVKLRKVEPKQRQEQEAVLDTYKAALGMLLDTPLGQAAMHRAEPEAKKSVPKAKPEISATLSVGKEASSIPDDLSIPPSLDRRPRAAPQATGAPG